MARQGLTAHQLELAAYPEGPTNRTINRWLRTGSRTSAGCVTVKARLVEAVAAALNVPVASLSADGVASLPPQVERLLNLVAAMGPIARPVFVSAFLPSESLERSGIIAQWFLPVRTPDRLATYRFARWSRCEELLAGGAGLSTSQARRALDLAAEYQLTVAGAPELHFMCFERLGRITEALEAGARWLTSARARGALREARWIGDRLLKHRRSLREMPVELVRQIVLDAAFAFRYTGRINEAMRVLATLALPGLNKNDPLFEARLELERARISLIRCHIQATLTHCDNAERLLHTQTGPRVISVRFAAMMQRVHVEQTLGLSEEAAGTLSRVEAYADDLTDPALLCQLRRLQGIAALDRADMAAVLEHFHDAIDIARSINNYREVGMGHVHLGIGYALVGRTQVATQHFETAVSTLVGSESGALLVGLARLNFGELSLSQGRLAAARRHFTAALGELERAGQFPGMLARAHALLAEVELLDGDFEASMAEATVAYEHGFDGGAPVDRAHSMALMACAAEPGSESASEFADAARELTRNLPERGLVVARLDLERLLAMATARVEPAAGHEAFRDVLHRATAFGLHGFQGRVETMMRVAGLAAA